MGPYRKSSSHCHHDIKNGETWAISFHFLRWVVSTSLCRRLPVSCPSNESAWSYMEPIKTVNQNKNFFLISLLFLISVLVREGSLTQKRRVTWVSKEQSSKEFNNIELDYWLFFAYCVYCWRKYMDAKIKRMTRVEQSRKLDICLGIRPAYMWDVAIQPLSETSFKFL